ncbi:DUF4419 domain-containing protein [Candidatus Falkowbacteria bacterium]|jgi:hypothetical protein|nr:DUF4419 domain-containing protein [Candidatus Falkowbacteria bacterium]MBT5502857.1 DUF4419 domain-containing protein [Candidatus Falkowbacteria bacterium]MBT6574612.1 DUF4419 domain-containing protein [Candidatus Falkowbacteria bacterium]MBT7348884.1 DUF4419 domain-containing protein [Candidatus Falkowbacteria bacterium]MBT7501035.1 DUF4419 domain-containing protein [Candidatus Falkowbacteria bacterium]
MRVIEIPGVEKREVPLRQVPNEAFLKSVIGEGTIKKTHFLSRSDLVNLKTEFDGVDIKNMSDDQRSRYWDERDNFFSAATVSHFVQAAHLAFANHVPFSLSPEVLWYAIAHEIAFHVKDNTAQYAHLFTDTPGAKQLIEVRDDTFVYEDQNDWLSAINKFRKPLRERMPTGIMELCLPQFSTLTPESETAITVTFMDTVSEYFHFRFSTLCGIPSFRMEGTVDDWKLLAGSVRALSGHITGLTQYFTVLQEVLDKLVVEYESTRPDLDFWDSFYKIGHGSGGPYVNGWVNILFAHGYIWKSEEGTKFRIKTKWKNVADCQRGGSFGGTTTNQFPSHVSKVDFIWNYYGKHIPMMLISGVFGTEMEDGFLTPKLGVGVIEKT